MESDLWDSEAMYNSGRSNGSFFSQYVASVSDKFEGDIANDVSSNINLRRLNACLAECQHSSSVYPGRTGWKAD